MKISGYDIAMVRGNSESIIVGIDGRTFTAGDVVTMAVSTSSGDVLFEKEVHPQSGKKVLFDIEPEDTKSLKSGNYVYSVNVKWSNNVTQLIVYAGLELLDS